MDIFAKNCSDPLFCVEDFSSSTEARESSSLSDSRANFSDEEVLLASNNPKKRAGRKKFCETRHPVYRGVRRRNSACLNFADSAWKLPVPASTDAKDIQKAAAEAAKAFGQSSSESDTREEAIAISPENVSFTDEEALFGMPELIDNMAEGLMLPPPYCMNTDDVEAYTDVSLWSYSI
ncbi:Dehydration-responsive element-binding protein 1D [Abeliophyllum distichum]|uniref:Dehydration-responsive element-binding protein 1D n=1 Tax=Abeliophyllum distichum TaxID=126358 RepID=A0ABD1UR74_9LAMI